ncbi:MAG: HlyD family efflux transporter periplasmic adaptor subunit, partial [Actinobacteria bacterium]|nr:HlyD family efflux transporter periplasmic adaptor subunit [Actinomycetota bacterium]
MLLATWNVNSLKARLPRVQAWIADVQPDVVLMQETKMTDKAFPALAFSEMGYDSAHFGQGQWNGVAIVSKVGLSDVQTNFAAGEPDAEARIITAPCDGTIFRISANVAQGGQYVKEDEPLAVIVPDTAERVVELMVDGVDSPLLTAFKAQSGAFPHVRLMFEGWPAIQVAGWPSVATGTFGGRVRQVDPTDDGNGRFRVLIEEDALEPADRWPEDSQLRQGNQAVGYI